MFVTKHECPDSNRCFARTDHRDGDIGSGELVRYRNYRETFGVAIINYNSSKYILNCLDNESKVSHSVIGRVLHENDIDVFPKRLSVEKSIDHDLISEEAEDDRTDSQ